jgi:hypothetical protein
MYWWWPFPQAAVAHFCQQWKSTQRGERQSGDSVLQVAWANPGPQGFGLKLLAAVRSRHFLRMSDGETEKEPCHLFEAYASDCFLGGQGSSLLCGLGRSGSSRWLNLLEGARGFGAAFQALAGILVMYGQRKH